MLATKNYCVSICSILKWQGRRGGGGDRGLESREGCEIKNVIFTSSDNCIHIHDLVDITLYSVNYQSLLTVITGGSLSK